MELPTPTQPIAAFDVTPRPSSEEGIEVLWARHLEEVRSAQQLRHRVFVEEMGARLPVTAGAPPDHDTDAFDRYCEHLLVRTRENDNSPGRVVGTYRVLTPWAAQRAGGLYSDTEFDLTPLAPLRAGMLELGRSCVDPAWRNGSVIMALWAALADFMRRNRLHTMIGCASVGMRDGGHTAASLWERLRHSHMAPDAYQVQPRLALPVARLERHHEVETPALIKGYLRCGAKVLGPPAWDPDFNTADLPLLMRLSELPARYRRHFLGH